MGFFKKLFKGIKKVVKGIGKVIKKVVKSKPFKAIAAVATAVFAPQLLPMVTKGLSTAAAWTASTIAKGATVAWNAAKAIGTGIKTFGSKVFSSITDTISNGVDFMKGKLGMKPTTSPTTSTFSSFSESVAGGGGQVGRTAVEEAGKKSLKTKVVEGLKTKAVNLAEQTITDAAKGGDDPTGQGAVQQFRYADEDIRVDTGAGYEQLASLGMGIQSPYLGYQQGQQLFGIRTA
tara:strand:- start:222 stop:920 length:699 start_codon:yes stop_codon:yes gene_type:complete